MSSFVEAGGGRPLPLPSPSLLLLLQYSMHEFGISMRCHAEIVRALFGVITWQGRGWIAARANTGLSQAAFKGQCNMVT